MSLKRVATTELNHDNWDQDDPSEHEDMGSFKTASKEVLEKRVIRTARRRTQVIPGEETKKSVFSGFGGFNKTQPSSFDFLSKLTNGNKPSNGSNKEETTVSSTFLDNKKPSPTLSSGGSVFGFSSSGATKTTVGSSIFTSSKADSTVGDNNFGLNNTTSKSPQESNVVQTSPSIFNKQSNSPNNKLFTAFSSTPLKSSQSSTTVKTEPINSNNETPKDKSDEEMPHYKLKYYSNLRALNESVLAWIKKHVEATPLCILSPIFKDYDNHLHTLQEEYNLHTKMAENKVTTEKKQDEKSADEKSKSSLFTSTNTGLASPSKGFFAAHSEPEKKLEGEKPSFSFGIKNDISKSSTGFSFGINNSTQQPNTTSAPSFSFGSNSSSLSSSSATPFSFGLGKPFSFNSNVQSQKPPEPSTEEQKEEEDEPPKVEYTPILEENSIYERKCKIFVKKDGNFVDKGVGTLYIKKIEESGKHQLLVRANTSLGNVLLNLVLASAIPTQRMGKNNVMLVCIPTPEAEPPPTPILIRVKTEEEADELLETLNKYKA